LKILIYMDALTFMRGKTGGVRKYAESIKKALEEEGHSCDWFYEASLQSLKSYDVVHVFSSFYPNLRFFKLATSQLPVVISPIYDPMVNSRWSIKGLLALSKLPGLWSNHGARKEMVESADYVFTMSQYEKLRLTRDYNVNFESKDVFFPSHYKTLEGRNPCKDLLFIGDIGNPRQNIKRLIRAVSDTGLSLTLIGGCSDAKIIELTEKHDKVTYLGYVSEETKLEEIKKHKVFVMPAYTSGFGTGAVEAAEYGLIIVYTKYGGTINYLNTSAIAINPFSKSELRSACIRATQSTSKGCLIERNSKDVVASLTLGYRQANKRFLERNI
jgi:glycosyltransferase involved in cell wall biosynthesis